MSKRFLAELDIKRHDDTAGTDDRERRGHPLGPIIGNDRSAISLCEPRMAEPTREPVHAAVQIRIAPCLRASFSESNYACRAPFPGRAVIPSVPICKFSLRAP